MSFGGGWSPFSRFPGSVDLASLVIAPPLPYRPHCPKQDYLVNYWEFKAWARLAESLDHRKTRSSMKYRVNYPVAGWHNTKSLLYTQYLSQNHTQCILHEQNRYVSRVNWLHASECSHILFLEQRYTNKIQVNPLGLNTQNNFQINTYLSSWLR